MTPQAGLAEAAYLKDKNGATHCGWRFHTHFEIDRNIPVRMEVTSALNGGKTDEKNHLRGRLEAATRVEAGELGTLDTAGARLLHGLLGGHHGKIERWRRDARLRATARWRPELVEAARQAGRLTAEDERFLASLH